MVIALSFFRFYYYVLIGSDKKYDILINEESNTHVIILLTPLASFVLFITLSFTSVVFTVPAILSMFMTTVNLLIVNKTSDRAFSIDLEKERARRKKINDEIREKMKEKQRQGQRRRTYDEIKNAIFSDSGFHSSIKIMGVSEDYTKQELRQSYRKLSRKHHPDLGGDSNTFIEVKKAYEYLLRRVN